MLGASLSWSQGNRYSYSLKLIDSTQVLAGTAELTSVNTSVKKIDTVYLHLPPRSLQYKKSFLHRQLAEFQKIDAYYAKKKERGFITVNQLSIDTKLFPVCKKCEFVSVPLSTSISPGDSIKISLDFEIQMGSSEVQRCGL